MSTYPLNFPSSRNNYGVIGDHKKQRNYFFPNVRNAGPFFLEREASSTQSTQQLSTFNLYNNVLQDVSINNSQSGSNNGRYVGDEFANNYRSNGDKKVNGMNQSVVGWMEGYQGFESPWNNLEGGVLEQFGAYVPEGLFLAPPNQQQQLALPTQQFLPPQHLTASPNNFCTTDSRPPPPFFRGFEHCHAQQQPGSYHELHHNTDSEQPFLATIQHHTMVDGADISGAKMVEKMGEKMVELKEGNNRKMVEMMKQCMEMGASRRRKKVVDRVRKFECARLVQLFGFMRRERSNEADAKIHGQFRDLLEMMICRGGGFLGMVEVVGGSLEIMGVVVVGGGCCGGWGLLWWVGVVVVGGGLLLWVGGCWGGWGLLEWVGVVVVGGGCWGGWGLLWWVGVVGVGGGCCGGWGVVGVGGGCCGGWGLLGWVGVVVVGGGCWSGWGLLWWVGGCWGGWGVVVVGWGCCGGWGVVVVGGGLLW